MPTSLELVAAQDKGALARSYHVCVKDSCEGKADGFTSSFKVEAAAFSITISPRLTTTQCSRIQSGW